jgi:hypothetical protein
LKRVTKGCKDLRNWEIWEEEVEGVAAKDQDGHGARASAGVGGNKGRAHCRPIR